MQNKTNEDMKKIREILENRGSLEHAITLLSWDLETEAPFLAAEKISKTLGYLIGESYSMIINDEFKKLIYGINTEELSEIDRKIVEEVKKESFEKMEKIQKGELQSPVRVKIKKVTPYTECDFTTVYAQVIKLKKIEGAKPKITKLKVKKLDESDDFDEPHLDEAGYLREYRVNSKDGYANMREKPTKDSKVISNLDNETIVRYITKYGDWYYVYFADYPSDLEKEWKVKEYRGFIHKSQLKKHVD